MKYLSENYTQHISITDICNHVGYSKSTVLSSFKREFGTTVNSKLCEIRLNAAKKLLEESEITINEIALCTGFADQSYFSKVFSAKYGITPSEYRKEQ
jgi:AraC-like DNA-binding protein